MNIAGVVTIGASIDSIASRTQDSMEEGLRFKFNMEKIEEILSRMDELQ